MKINDLYKLFLECSTIVTDSRKIEPNSIYFSLKGESFNGNNFAKEALEKGAKYAIIDEKTDSSDKRLVLVNNVLDTLQQLANHHRLQFDIPIIGITGTNGKTTTKELVYTTLSTKYNTLATKGNLNNHIGVPLTLLELNAKHEIAIIEMGANHVGEILELCKIAEPNYGIVTNVGKAHLEGFGSFERIIETKKSLYDYVNTKKGINFALTENTLLNTNLESNNTIYYSCSDSNTNNFGKGEINNSYLNVSIEKLDGQITPNNIINTQIVGLYNQYNILAAITIGNYFKIPLNQIKIALENYSPTNNRSELKKTKRNQLILDAYNANPTSVTNALENFIEMKHSNKIIILGDMLELGNYSENEHQKIVNLLIKYNLKTIIIGLEFLKTDTKGATHINKYSKTKELINSNTIQEFSDSLILIKGSRGMQLEELSKYL